MGVLRFQMGEFDTVCAQSNDNATARVRHKILTEEQFRLWPHIAASTPVARYCVVK